jgi:hypothetical protein
MRYRRNRHNLDLPPVLFSSSPSIQLEIGAEPIARAEEATRTPP